MKNKKILIGIGILVICIIVASAWVLTSIKPLPDLSTPLPPDLSHLPTVAQEITKEQAIAIADATEEVQEFLKMYPEAKIVDVIEPDKTCTTGDCDMVWGVTYHNGIGNFQPSGWASEAGIIRINVNIHSGNVTFKFPKLEYIKNSKYCEKDKDCICKSSCGCENFIHSGINKKCISDEEGFLCFRTGCKCENEACT